MANGLDHSKLMIWVRFVAATVLLTSLGLPGESQGQTSPVAAFKSSVDLVRLAVVVRDRKGRFVPNVAARDLEILDAGQPQSIGDFRHDLAGVSVALLFDISGSMEDNLPNACEAATHLLGWLENDRDEAAVFAFDTALDELTPFTPRLRTLPASILRLTAFGETSLHDAVAETARLAGQREGRRRAVVVLTDGMDTASRLTPPEVSAIAADIDVPVYVVGVVPGIDNPSADVATPSVARVALEGPLADLAAWTGGHVFVVSTPAERAAAGRQIVDELRHQYLIAFPSSSTPGWHPLVVRARDKTMIVRARGGYIARVPAPTAPGK
jgi:Ca-activated chloride channel family protein